MTLRDAIIARIEELSSESGKAAGRISLDGGGRTTTLYDFMKGRTKMLKVDTLKAVCQGVNVTLKDFFDRPYFNDYQD